MLMQKTLVQLMLAVLFTHEMDAMTQRGLAMFCIIHAVLHWRLADDPLSTFSSPLSWGLILGAAALGAAYLGIEVQDARSRKN